jgi:hypothetical protein
MAKTQSLFPIFIVGFVIAICKSGINIMKLIRLLP